MTVLDFVLLVLAAGQIIDTWKFPGGILEEYREAIVTWSQFDGELPRWRDRVRYRIGELAECRFCLSHWTPLALLLMCYMPSLFVTGWAVVLWRLPIYSLAATKVVRLLQVLAEKFYEK